MNRYDFNARMALWSKGKEYKYEWDADGRVKVYPINGKEDLTAIIDPEKSEVLYHIEYGQACTGSYIPVDELHDLERFVRLLTEGEL